MRRIPLSELRDHPSEVLKGLRKEGVLITRNGRPAAALVLLDQPLLEQFALNQDRPLNESLQKAMKEYRRKGGVTQSEMMDRLRRRG